MFLHFHSLWGVQKEEKVTRSCGWLWQIALRWHHKLKSVFLQHEDVHSARPRGPVRWPRLAHVLETQERNGEQLWQNRCVKPAPLSTSREPTLTKMITDCDVSLSGQFTSMGWHLRKISTSKCTKAFKTPCLTIYRYVYFLALTKYCQAFDSLWLTSPLFSGLCLSTAVRASPLICV